ncbi:MAG: hypothetical protein OEY98_06890 [Acidimicrobiia bacterium]|nr:hypothetical protein [Acidimicrobiia bacterium]
MNVFETIQRNRRIVIIAAAAVYLITAVALGAGLISGSIEVFRAVGLAIAATLPATLALMSLDQRPSLLTVAWMAAVVSAFVVITASPIWVVVALAWGFASRNRPRPAPDARWMTVARPLMALAVVVPIFVMFVHADPVCTVTYRDGRTESVDPATRGMATGWQFGSSFGSTTGMSSGTSVGSDTESEQCSSDTVVWWEAVASVLASAAVLGVASRWPTSDQLAREADPVGV